MDFNDCRAVVLYNPEQAAANFFKAITGVDWSTLWAGPAWGNELYRWGSPPSLRLATRPATCLLSYEVCCRSRGGRCRYLTYGQTDGECVERAWAECDGTRESFEYAVHQYCDPGQVFAGDNMRRKFNYDGMKNMLPPAAGSSWRLENKERAQEEINKSSRLPGNWLQYNVSALSSRAQDCAECGCHGFSMLSFVGGQSDRKTQRKIR
ncbi:hypothetical protein DFH06DRAFT_1138685 [Mycena polygramma]|nr:hypothetical protein DFH06DRAFT_1138685 [Mycena polygramma]